MPSFSAVLLFVRYWPTVTGQQIKVNDRSALVDGAPRDLFYAPTQFDYLAHRLLTQRIVYQAADRVPTQIFSNRPLFKQ